MSPIVHGVQAPTSPRISEELTFLLLNEGEKRGKRKGIEKRKGPTVDPGLQKKKRLALVTMPKPEKMRKELF